MAVEFKDLEQAVTYGKGLLEDVDVMINPRDGVHHVIRTFGTKHWMAHGYRLVAVIRIEARVTMIGTIIKEVEA